LQLSPLKVYYEKFNFTLIVTLWFYDDPLQMIYTGFLSSPFSFRSGSIIFLVTKSA